MSRWRELHDFEKRFPDDMELKELRYWRNFWKQQAETLAPKVKRQAMKRVYAIEAAISQREAEQQ